MNTEAYFVDGETSQMVTLRRNVTTTDMCASVRACVRACLRAYSSCSDNYVYMFVIIPLQTTFR